MPLSMFRRVAVDFAIGGSVLLAVGCSTTTAPPKSTTTAPAKRAITQHVGVVTGVASPCWPYPSNRGIGKKTVTVTVSRNGQTVSSQTVRGDHFYAFKLSPGNYDVSTLYSRARPVMITTGGTVKVDLPDDCA